MRKRKLLKKGVVFFLIPTTVQHKKPGHIKYFASEFKITFKGKKKAHQGSSEPAVWLCHAYSSPAIRNICACKVFLDKS